MMGKFTGKPDQFHGKNHGFRLRFSQQNQSNDMGLSENRLNPIVPNGFADHYPYEKWLAIIGNINPTFSDIPI